jgi:hypothetical protein
MALGLLEALSMSDTAHAARDLNIAAVFAHKAVADGTLPQPPRVHRTAVGTHLW